MRPSISARTKPDDSSCSSTSTCSPLRSCTTGASRSSELPSGIASTWSTIWLTLCAVNLLAVLGAARNAGTRKQHAQVVIDLGDRADRRARVVRRRFLLDRDRRRESLDMIDVGLFHDRQELPGVRRQRLDVASLSLGVDRVERERRFARAGQTRHDDQAIARQIEIDATKVVGAGTADSDHVHRSGLQVSGFQGRGCDRQPRTIGGGAGAGKADVPPGSG